MTRRFKTKQEALNWMLQEEMIHGNCIDNSRFAFTDDDNEMRIYQEQVDHGCCGFYENTVIVDGRWARIGCNYGH